MDRTIVWVYNSRDFQPRACRIIRSGETVLRVGIQELAGRCEVESEAGRMLSRGGIQRRLAVCNIVYIEEVET